ncbi:hypothetical protein RFI_05624 [Reticulomyxa filosa]|uniref:Small-subunit processome Utp12 domain-containing protein n=1 Tax=Reticulomyxa filosa TaxID=46433 RepID=X6NYW3_RETFI|nr:hypothetical protein RFI_05624 [Reticulomyxa filosa]|eukprot:ETO31495.1 hypothetical protein RFI_05624 [Reticulomyxa filosa]
MTSIPLDHISLTLQFLPVRYLEKILNVCAVEIVKTQYLQFFLQWIHSIFSLHGPHIKTHCLTTYSPVLRLLQKNLNYYYKNLKPICDGNNSRLEFLSSFAESFNGVKRKKLILILLKPNVLLLFRQANLSPFLLRISMLIPLQNFDEIIVIIIFFYFFLKLSLLVLNLPVQKFSFKYIF